MTSIWRKSIMTSCSEGGNGVLLIESTQSNVSLHELCVYTHIISCAKQLLPVFINRIGQASTLKEVLPRYFEKFQIVEDVKLSGGSRLWLFAISAALWLYQFFRRDLVNLHWRGELVGDIVYDQYLAGTQKGTVDYFDGRLVKYIYITLRAVERDRRLLGKINPAAVLLSHRVGLNSADEFRFGERPGHVVTALLRRDLGHQPPDRAVAAPEAAEVPHVAVFAVALIVEADHWHPADAAGQASPADASASASAITTSLAPTITWPSATMPMSTFVNLGL